MAQQNVMDIIEAARQAELQYIATDLPYYIAEYVHIEDKDAAEVIVPFDLWPAQRELLGSIHSNRLNIILKARQLGVTWLTLAYASWCLLCNAGWLIIALSRTEDEAKELVRRLTVILSHMPALLREDCKENEQWRGIKYKSTTLSIDVIFPDGRISTFKAFPSSSGAGRSFTANVLILDEWAFQQAAEQIWLSVYPTINRPTGGKVIGLSTIERGTLFEQLYLDAHEGKNNFNALFLAWDADPRRTAQWYEQTKRDLGDLIMQEYPATVSEALTIPGGSFFPEFQRHIHVKPPQADTDGYRRYVCIDYGLDMLSVHWVWIDTEYRARVYREFDAPNMTISDACAKILELSGDERIDLFLAPPDLWNRSQESGRSRALIFGENGVPLTRTHNDLESGCAAMKEWLKPVGDTAALTFDEGAAPNLVRCLTKIQKDKNRPNIYAKEPHDLTHDVDSLRCFCVYWTAPAETPQNKRYIKWTTDMWEDWQNANEEMRKLLIMKWGEPN